ncbi:hypothetical protein [Aestuariivivens sediminis]|uniref:hypothetical protein n=1 Tax=Aestuariivivens sediminis TaxID=2913557 RepID=UPI001F5A267C|nr:hypothetical protein [Aestuariivivens sediminis]
MNRHQLILFWVVCLMCYTMNAQLMDKLKQRAKERGIATSAEVTYDSTAYDPNMSSEDDDEFEDLVITSPEEFFNMDVVMALYDANGALVQTSYFDKETIAMRTESKANPKPLYHDRSGKFYAYDADIDRYKTMALLPGSSMGFMTAGLTTQVYKLPPTPYFQAFEALSKMDVAMNFLILEMAFVYKPEHFENNAFYIKSIEPCKGRTCTRYSYNDVEYQGSYIQFDDQDRLYELHIISTNPQLRDDKNPSGRFSFRYEPVSVELPDAVEQSLVPGPLGKILPLEKGLEPWKHNKKDKE